MLGKMLRKSWFWLLLLGALLGVAAPAAPYSGPRLFGAGPTEPVADLRVRGQLQPERRRAVYAVRIQTGGSPPASVR